MKPTFDVSENDFRSKLLDGWENSEPGFQKSGSEIGTKLIRRSIKENRFCSLIVPFEPIEDSKLYEDEHSEEPSVLCHMEPESKIAKAIPFSDTADTAFFRGDKFRVFFAKVSTPWYTKNVQELRTYSYDLRKVVADNGVRAIHTAQDNRFMAGINRTLGTVGGVGVSGRPQITTYAGGIQRSSYRHTLSDLEDRQIPNGTFLLNRRTAKAFLDFDASVIGDEMAGRSIRDGLEAFTRDGGQLSIYKVPHISTIKNQTVPNNQVYQFGPSDFMGRAFVLEELRMYVEKKVDILRFASWEICGFTIANVAAIHKSIFDYVD